MFTLLDNKEFLLSSAIKRYSSTPALNGESNQCLKLQSAAQKTSHVQIQDGSIDRTLISSSVFFIIYQIIQKFQ